MHGIHGLISFKYSFSPKSNDRYFDSLNLMIEAAVSGLGIAIAPQILVEKEMT